MQTQTRIVGSNFTTFTWANQPIAFLDEVQDSGQPPIVEFQAVTPLGSSNPAEFALPRVKSYGTLNFTIRELWSQPAWWNLAGLAGTNNIIDVYNNMANTPSPIGCSTIITLPSGQTRGWTYINVVLTTISDSEDITIGALTTPRNLTAVYGDKKYFTSGTTS
jgi:hypothetical protein